MMRAAMVFASLTLLVAAPAGAATKVFYLDHARAVGFPELVDRLTRGNSSWVEALRPHWGELKAQVKVRADTNAIEARGSAEALAALESVIEALDAPRRTVSLSYRYVRVPDAAMLLGRPAGPPTPGEPAGVGERGAVEVWIAPGKWTERVVELTEAGDAAVLHEGEVNILDGFWHTVYIGDPEAAPQFCLQARPLLMEAGGLSLALAFGRVTRQGSEAPDPKQPADNALQLGECVACGPGLGDVRLVPELRVSSLLLDRQSLLLGGLRWYGDPQDSVGAPRDEFLVVSASVEGE